MADPLRYFPEAKQKEMAGQVWELAGRKTRFYSAICEVNQFRFTSPDAKRVLHAKDWCTYWRQDGSPEDNDAVNRELGHPRGYYSGECIADVEHFFVAAFMEVAIGPSLTQLGIVGWETVDILLKRPVMNAAHAYNHGRDVSQAFFNGFPGGLRGWFDSIEWNYGQAIRAQAGIVFGSELPEGYASNLPIAVNDPNGVFSLNMARVTTDLRSAIHFIRQALADVPPKPPTPAPGPPPSSAPNPGIPDKEFLLDFGNPNKRSLSAIAKTVYGTFDLWPLIWWHNQAKGVSIPNPNRLQGLKTVRYRELNSYTASDVASAKAAAPTWKNYPL